MPQADFFVKTTGAGGNDGSDGTSWATAKATVNAAAGLVTGATPAKIVAVAPGVYPAESITPGSVGSSGAHHKIIIDTQEVYTDGGANTHGLGRGLGVFYTSDATVGFSLYSVSNIGYWDVHGVVGIGLRGIDIGHTSAGPVKMNLLDSVGISIGNTESAGVWMAQYGELDRGIAAYRVLGLRLGYGRGLSCRTYNASSFHTNPDFLFQACYGHGTDVNGFGGGIVSTANSATTYTYAEVEGCFAKGAADANYGAAFRGYSTNPNQNKFLHARNVLLGPVRDCLEGAGSVGNDYYWGIGAGSYWGTSVVLPYMPSADFIYPNSPIKDILSDFSGSLSEEGVYDLIGQLRTQTPGPNEYTSNMDYLIPLSNALRGLYKPFTIAATQVGGGGGIMGVF